MLLDTKLASLLAILSAVTATPQCPPAGWETCSSAWPPPADGYCCSAAGWLGNTAAHCSNINALDECCSLNDEGRLTCVTECEEPPAVCTGDAAIDAVLFESKIGCKIGLIDSNEIYKCDRPSPPTTRRRLSSPSSLYPPPSPPPLPPPFSPRRAVLPRCLCPLQPQLPPIDSYPTLPAQVVWLLRRPPLLQ